MTDDWLQIADDFATCWNLPRAIGALDGRRITMNKPKNSGLLYRNYKGTFSIVLLAVVDARYRFLYIDVGCNGRISDGGVFNRSTLAQAINDNSLNIPQPRDLPGTDVQCPFYFVADDAFKLSESLMKPYPFRNMSKPERIYNYRISRGRRIVENAFGILAQRFRFLQANLALQPTTVQTLTLAACALHNFLRSRTTYMHSVDIDREDPVTHVVHEAQWRQAPSNMRNVSSQIGARTRHTDNAKDIRQCLRDYFSSPAGAVPWQDQMIHNSVTT